MAATARPLRQSLPHQSHARDLLSRDRRLVRPDHLGDSDGHCHAPASADIEPWSKRCTLVSKSSGAVLHQSIIGIAPVLILHLK